MNKISESELHKVKRSDSLCFTVQSDSGQNAILRNQISQLSSNKEQRITPDYFCKVRLTPSRETS